MAYVGANIKIHPREGTGAGSLRRIYQFLAKNDIAFTVDKVAGQFSVSGSVLQPRLNKNSRWKRDFAEAIGRAGGFFSNSPIASSLNRHADDAFREVQEIASRRLNGQKHVPRSPFSKRSFP